MFEYKYVNASLQCQLSKVTPGINCRKSVEMLTITKLRPACAVFVALFFATSQASSYHVTDLQLENSYTFTSNVNLYTVWLTNTTLHLNSTDTNLKSCSIAINPAKDSTINRIQAKALTSGRKFVIWGIRAFSYLAVEPDVPGTFETEYTFLLVDPWACTYKSVSVPISKRDLEATNNEIHVIANADSFDVFVASEPNCSPCRFGVEGQELKLEHQLEFFKPNLEPKNLKRILHIQPFHPIDRKQGYFFARNFENNTAVIEKIDETYKTLKQLYVDNPIHSVSIWPGKDPLLSVCYASQNHYSEASNNLQVQCQQLGSDLQPKLSIRLPAPAKNNFVYGMQHLTHEIDPLGNTYIGLIESNAEKNHESYKYLPRKLRFYAYDKTGKLLESQDFDIADASSMSDIDSHRFEHQLHSHLLVGNKFCLVDNEFVSKSEIKVHEIVRCFDIQTYYKNIQ